MKITERQLTVKATIYVTITLALAGFVSKEQQAIECPLHVHLFAVVALTSPAG